MWTSIFKDYVKQNCNEKGDQKTDQLTNEQELGRLKLLKRVAKGEIIIMPSDKGKGLVVMTKETYEKMAQEHVGKDEIVDWDYLKSAQNEVRAHGRSLIRIFNVGKAGGPRNAARCHDNVSSWAQDPPVLRCVAKTHKPVGPDGIPKSRPIVAASEGLTTALGEILSDVIEPIARTRGEDEHNYEAQSTEELMRDIEDTSIKAEEEGWDDLVVGSMDVVALYPSIDQTQAAKVVARRYLESGIVTEDVNYRAASIYLAVNADRDELIREGLAELIPARVHTRGRKPTARTR